MYFEEDILPGDILEMDNSGMVTSMTVQDLSVTANPSTDIVSGSAPANSWASLYISNYNESYETDLAIGADGTFALDLSATFDVQHMTSVYLEWYNNEGDGVETSYRVPGVGAYEGYDYGYGYSSLYDTLVNLDLYDASYNLKATAAITTTSYGYFYTAGFCNAGATVDVALGDSLYSPDSSVPVVAVYKAIDVDNDVIYGSAYPYAVLYITPRSPSNNWYWGSEQVTADASGVFSLNYSGMIDLQAGDYATVTWIGSEGDRVYYLASSVSNTGSVAITSYPDAARPNSSVYIGWEMSGGVQQMYSYLRWDIASHACDRNYRYSAGAYSGEGGQYSGSFTAPAAGTIYVSAYGYIDGYQVWSPEIAIPVEWMAPVITNPVNGTTNDNTPTLEGFGPPGYAIEFYGTGWTYLGSTTVSAEGEFSYTLPAALSEGENLIAAYVPDFSLVSNTVYLTVDSSLMVDPNHIFFTDRDNRFRIHDDQGYANLGGQIWIRPNDTAEIELPVRTCQDMYGVTLTVGAVVYPMYYAGDEIWVGSFLLPSSNYAIIANINCGGTVTDILLTYGLIDPDGYVYDAKEGWIMQGAQVTCYRYNETTGVFEEWDAATWDQFNPQWTDSDGYYSFVVPPGQYKVKASNPGYIDAESPVLTVVDAPIHFNIPMYYISNYTYLALVTK